MSRKNKSKHQESKTSILPENTRNMHIDIKPINATQRKYLKQINQFDITFAMGSAGSGKTFLAVLMAMKYFCEGKVDRIIVCRPAVNADGEDLGALPGGINEKMDPYIRPIFDAFKSHWSVSTIRNMLANEKIEIVPLAFMRGRSFKNCFIIADECQNATSSQLLMLLTRLGEGTKMVITGDPLQSDINGASCFHDAYGILSPVPEIGFITFNNADVVRHPVVEKILNVWPQENAIEIKPFKKKHDKPITYDPGLGDVPFLTS